MRAHITQWKYFLNSIVCAQAGVSCMLPVKNKVSLNESGCIHTQIYAYARLGDIWWKPSLVFLWISVTFFNTHIRCAIYSIFSFLWIFLSSSLHRERIFFYLHSNFRFFFPLLQWFCLDIQNRGHMYEQFPRFLIAKKHFSIPSALHRK